MESEEHSTAGMTKSKWLVVVILLTAVLAIVFMPLTKKVPPVGLARVQALNNIHELGAVLAQFEADYGRFPDDDTALEVKRRTKTGFTLTGEYSNDYFRQLLAGDAKGKSEKPFWCNTPLSPKGADDNFSSPAKALEAGEVGFSYIMASPKLGQSSKEDPGRTVVVAPSYRFQTDWTFDPDAFAGVAVALRVDGSVTTLDIRKDPGGGRDRKAMISEEKTLGDIGAGTPWGTSTDPFMRTPQPGRGNE